jgi:hypothetical protein
MSPRMLTLALVLGSPLLGCVADREPAPPAPGGSGSRSPARTPSPDRGSGGSGGSAHFDAGLEDWISFVQPQSCIDIDTSDGSNAVSAPEEFRVGYGFAELQGPCPHPHLLIGIGDGSCARRGPRQLHFSFDTERIEEGLLLGEAPVQLDAEPNLQGIQARFAHRPEGSEPVSPVPDRGFWGTCRGAGGELALQSLDTASGALLEGEFALQLTPCSPEHTEPGPLRVEGAFRLNLVRGLEGVCPAF